MAIVELRPFSREDYHIFWREYVADPAMMSDEYAYDEGIVNALFDRVTADPQRRMLAVTLDSHPIGEVQLKRIDMTRRCGTLSIHFSCDRYKNHGYGTQAERLMLKYASDVLGLKTVYADAVLRNVRSAHILEKLGFKHIGADDGFNYYVLNMGDKNDG